MNKMTKKIIQTLEYCMFGNQYGCPRLVGCEKDGVYSMKVLIINEEEKKASDPDFPKKEIIFDRKLEKKIKGGFKWNVKGKEDEKYICIETIKERNPLGRMPC